MIFSAYHTQPSTDDHDYSQQQMPTRNKSAIDVSFPHDAIAAVAAFLPLTASNSFGEMLVDYDDEKLQIQIIEHGE